MSALPDPSMHHPLLPPPPDRRPTAAAPLLSCSAGNINYAPGACERLEPFLSSRILGQEMALRQISDAICDHLAQPEPARPLVLSLHGPPGVGKSMFHLLAAHALYNRQPDRPGLRCPGLDCAGYKVGWGRRVSAAGAAQRREMQRRVPGRRGLKCRPVWAVVKLRRASARHGQYFGSGCCGPCPCPCHPLHRTACQPRVGLRTQLALPSARLAAASHSNTGAVWNGLYGRRAGSTARRPAGSAVGPRAPRARVV